MKFLRQLTALFSLFTLFVVSSCQRDLDVVVPDNNNIGQTLNPSPVQASVTGKVVDENEVAVVGATVTSGNHSTVTDSRGLFRFDNISLDKYASVVTVNYNGYFKGIRTFAAREASSNFVKIKLTPKTLAGTVSSASGGAVTLPDNSIVTLQANSVVVKSTGQAYTGTINVYAANINPTLDDISQTVPGSFQAIDANNYRVLLKSYGMLAVQLEGQSGELLQIATTKTAKLRFTIPASLQSAAPASIPLWSLNETDGLWKQEGSATKTGNYYEGDVAHFSFWNCDAGNNTVYLEMTIVDAANNHPLPYSLVKLTLISNGSYSYGFTDSTGQVDGLVFSNENMLMEVLSNCGQTVYSQNIGPFTQNTNLGTVAVTVAAPFSLNVSGNAVDCSNNPVTDGNAYIYWEGQVVVAPISNGSFAANIIRCSNSTANVDVIVVDNTTHEQSTTWTGTISSADLNTGTLTACGVSTQEYINYSVNGTNYSFNAPPDSITYYYQPGSVYAYFNGNNSSNDYIAFNMDYTNLGVDSLRLIQYITSSQFGNTTTVNFPTPIYATITEYGAIGQYISGNFSGTVLAGPPPSTTYNISVSFRVRRMY